MKKLTGPIIGLHFMRNNSVVIDTTHGLIPFPHLTMEVKTASSETTTKPQPVIMDEDLTIPPATTKTVIAFIDHPSKWRTTGTVTPLEKFTETASLLISHSMSTIIDKRIAVRVTNTTESPYLIKKHTQIAEFSVVTPEQSKHIKPVDMATLSMIPQDDCDLTAYLIELLRTNKPEQQDNTFWFPTPENPGKSEVHTPIQLRTLKELSEPKEKETPNPQESTVSQNKILNRFNWTDTLQAETEKQAVEDILVDYNGIFATHRMDIGMNTEFKKKLTPKDDKAVYSQNLPMSIHLKEDLIVELALVHKKGIITVLLFSKYASPVFAQRKPNGKLCLLVDLRKINSLIADDYTNNLQICQMQHNTWLGSHYSESLTAPRFIIACRWRTNVRWKCLHSILLAELLARKDLLKVLAGLCRDFQVSCVSFSKLTIVLNTRTTLESQPMMLRASPRTFEQSSSAFAK